MEKKNKKKLFAIIGASALAFVLTIALSVSITLAYFGDLASASGTVAMGGTVAVNDTLSLTGTASGVVPGQTVSISVAGKIETSSTQYGAAIMLLNVSSDITDDTLATAMTNAFTTTTDNASVWAKVDGITATKDGKTYVVYQYIAGRTGSDTMTAISLSSDAAKEVTFAGQFTAPTTWTNDTGVHDKTLTINATLVAVQNGIENLSTEKTFDTLKTIFADVAGVTFSA